jgi:hypothetical protein
LNDFAGRNGVATNPNADEQRRYRDYNRESEALHGINLKQDREYVQVNMLPA